MREVTQQEKLMSIGISMLALGIFPLIWFLSQALLFRELTDAISTVSYTHLTLPTTPYV